MKQKVIPQSDAREQGGKGVQTLWEQGKGGKFPLEVGGGIIIENDKRKWLN